MNIPLTLICIYKKSTKSGTRKMERKNIIMYTRNFIFDNITYFQH